MPSRETTRLTGALATISSARVTATRRARNNGSDGLVGGLGNDRLDGGAGELNIAVYVEAPGAVVPSI